jgi:hypothetical protein
VKAATEIPAAPELGTAYVSAAQMSVSTKGNRFKLFLVSILPWKKELRITVPAAAIFINPPPPKGGNIQQVSKKSGLFIS